MEEEVEHMMGAQFPIRLISQNHSQDSYDCAEYVRNEFGDSNPAWLMYDAKAATNGSIKRMGLVFRGIVSRVASFLP